MKRGIKHLKGIHVNPPQETPITNLLVFTSIQANINFLQSRFHECPDLVIRMFEFNSSNKRGAIVYLDSLTDSTTINQQLMNSIIHSYDVLLQKNEASFLNVLTERLLAIGRISEVGNLDSLIRHMLSGNTLLFVDGIASSLVIHTVGGETRSISDPINENEVKGSRESFVENINTNISMIRRKIRNDKLRFVSLVLGEKTNTNVCVVFLHDSANPELVAEVRRRLANMNQDKILNINYIEETITDHPYSLFPQLNYTERPDRAAAMLLEGRVLILSDGLPLLLIIPSTFFEFFTTAGDYYHSFYFTTLLRWMRLLAFLFAIILPSLYIAITTMHQEMIPTPLALKVAATRSGVPFPAIIEALLMEFAFELLREAGIRLPRVAGQAVNIVGALIIGEAAVEAGLVSPIMVVVVAVTGISSFAVPNYNLSIAARVIRFILMIAASILGIPGMAIVLVVLLVYVASLSSFGVPYLTPISPAVFADWRDSVIRAPFSLFKHRIHNYQNQPIQNGEFELRNQSHEQG